jgi:formamidopyrimidine-DNA glycosylase
MIKSYHHGGAQLRDFKNPNISSSLKLNVYNKKTVEGKKIIKKITSDNRISYWCPAKQKVKN